MSVSNVFTLKSDQNLKLNSNVPGQFFKENPDKLFNFYSDFFKNLSTKFPINNFEWMLKGFESVDSCDFSWPDLEVEMPFNTVEKVLKNTGVLQLRPVLQDCKTLIVGCGNTPIANSAGYPLFVGELDSEEEFEAYKQRLLTSKINKSMLFCYEMQ